MRTTIVLLSALGMVFVAGLTFGLLLQVPSGEVGPIRIRGRRGIGLDIGIGARRYGDLGQDATASPASDADRDWDTYDSGAASTEPA